MNGEIGVKVVNLFNLDEHYVRPSFLSRNMEDGTASTDLSMHLDDGGCFHICGNNDWAFLALDLLEPLKKEAADLLVKAHRMKSDLESEGKNVVAFAVGLNDKRILDVWKGGRDACKELCGVPVVVVKEHDDYLSPLFGVNNRLPF